MRNLDHFLELLQLKWASVSLVILLVVVACLSVFYFKWGAWPKIALVTVSLTGIVWVSARMPRDYNLILLSGEEDNAAESGFSYLEEHLSDDQLTRLLSVEGNNRCLASNNVRFYLALIAARRGLLVTNAADLRRPRFFSPNSYNGFANGLNYPISYQEFFQKYQETVNHKEQK